MALSKPSGSKRRAPASSVDTLFDDLLEDLEASNTPRAIRTPWRFSDIAIITAMKVLARELDCHLVEGTNWVRFICLNGPGEGCSVTVTTPTPMLVKMHFFNAHNNYVVTHSKVKMEWTAQKDYLLTRMISFFNDHLQSDGEGQLQGENRQWDISGMRYSALHAFVTSRGLCMAKTGSAGENFTRIIISGAHSHMVILDRPNKLVIRRCVLNHEPFTLPEIEMMKQGMLWPKALQMLTRYMESFFNLSEAQD